jgi:hypothetical protein
MSRRIGWNRLPFKAVEEIVRRERAGCWDLYAALGDLRLEIRDSLAPLGSRFRLRLPDGMRVIEASPTPHSMAQICNLLRVPAQFLERLPAAVGLKLLRTLQDTSELCDGRRFLMRLRGKDRPLFRAVLPASYVRADDLEIIAAIKNARGNALDAHLAQIDADSLCLRLALNEPAQAMNLGTAQKKDRALLGLSLLSSETGAHPLEIRHLVLRLVCENGLTVPVEGEKAFSRRLTQVDRSVIFGSLHAALDSMVPRGRDLAGRLAESRTQMVPDPAAEIRSIFQRHRLGNPNGRLGRWVTDEVGRQMTLFGAQRFELVQAFTAVARGLESGDRLRFEDAMGRYVLEAA